MVTQLTPDRQALLARLIDEGATMSALRDEHGFNHSSVRKLYPDYRKAKPRIEEDADRARLLARLVDEGVDLETIASEYGISYVTVRKYYPNYRAKPGRLKEGSERLELLDKLVAEGVGVSVMQRQYGFNYATVRSRYPDYRVRGTWSVVPEVTMDKVRIVREMAEDRAPVSAIASATGLSRASVLKIAPDATWTKVEAAQYAGSVSRLMREIDK